MAQALKSELGITAPALRIIADARLRDFEALWKAGQHHSAIYMAGYVAEEYLKCAICKTLKLPNLPRVFEFHDLETLLLFSGFQVELRSNEAVSSNFDSLEAAWDVNMRYEDPSESEIDEKTCIFAQRWLNDPKEGIVPWFRNRL